MSAPQVSFEFFPPKTPEMEQKLWDSVQRLAPVNPRFVSVTYGAGGSTRERTHSIVKRMVDETALTPAGHITCVAATKAEIDGVLRGYWDAGVKRIVALRGDPTAGIGATYEPHPNGYAYASDLIAGARRIGDFDVSVGCYPEVHPNAGSLANEIDNLKRKLDAGARPGDHAVLLLSGCLFPFPRRGRSDAASRADRSGRDAAVKLQGTEAHGEVVRRDDPQPRRLAL